MMKRRFWTGSEFIPISGAVSPPLAKGGLGGIGVNLRIAVFVSWASLRGCVRCLSSVV